MDAGDDIYIVTDGTLRTLPSVQMREGLFGAKLEDALQSILQQYPELIPGRQIAPDEEEPPRFLLLRREMPLSGWSLDLLMVDQRGVLTLVEAKLMQNPESRRDVIGQIIEYAANAFELWASGAARQYAAEYWNRQGRELDEVLREAFGADIDPDSFWETVEANLRQGRIRMIIAGDALRPEVRRMIEYLNGEMQNAEVLGLELKCYGREGEPVVMVPAIVGHSVLASRAKRTASAPGTTNRAAVLGSVPEPVAAFFNDVMDKAKDLGMVLNYGEKGLSVRAINGKGAPVSILYLFPPGTLGRREPFLHAYGTYLKETDIPQELLNALLPLPGARKYGDYSVEVTLAGAGLDTGKKAAELMFSFRDKIAQIT